jgi:histidine kinase
MTGRPTLRSRLAVTYVGVVAAVMTAGGVTIALLTPNFVQQRLQQGFQQGAGRGAGPGRANPPVTVPNEVDDAWREALTSGLVVAGVIGLVIALVLAFWLSRRMLGHLTEMEVATERMASGDYRHRVDLAAEAELADLGTSINTLGARLAETEQTRAQLVSDLAHELRNPLATIEGYMEGLIDGVLPPSTETFSIVAAEANRLGRLTNDLSLLSKAQEGALELDLEPVDLTDVASSVGERLRPQYEVKGVDLIVEGPSGLRVMADRDRLTQAVMNVVGNALTHTPPGGSVSVHTSGHGATCRLDVVDTGAGLQPGQEEVIFERFTRLDADTAGTGLGLNIARTITRLHGGDLTANSDGPGLGSTFTFALRSGRNAPGEVSVT